MPELCRACGGDGYVLYDDVECCGRYLETGECCAARYGTANLEPVQRQEMCPACFGSGWEEDA